jgi:hypothetical protein
MRVSLNGKRARLLTILTIAFLMLSPVFLVPLVAAQIDEQTDDSQYFSKEYSWDYGGNHWTWNLTIPKALYEAYKAVDPSVRTRNGPEGYGYLTTTNDYYVRSLAFKLNQTTSELGYDSFDQVSFILAFVQSLPYTSDKVTTGYDEYPRFPIETLVADGGDCEDTAILFATITLILGYGTVYINPPDHYSVGVLGNDLSGTYWTYHDRKYYYCETTGSGFKIGQLPDEFKGQNAYVYGIEQNQQYVPPIAYPTDNPEPTSASSGAPTIQPLLPLSFNLIENSPVLFVIIILAIIISLWVAIQSVNRPVPQQAAQQVPLEQPPSPSSCDSAGVKFCVYCGAPNRAYAAYCESCGQKIA